MLDRVIAFRSSMSMVRELLNKGFITVSDFAMIQEKLAVKYGLDSRSIFAEIA